MGKCKAYFEPINEGGLKFLHIGFIFLKEFISQGTILKEISVIFSFKQVKLRQGLVQSPPRPPPPPPTRDDIPKPTPSQPI